MDLGELLDVLWRDPVEQPLSKGSLYSPVKPATRVVERLA